MARQRVPASEKKGKSETQEQLKERQYLEEVLRGKSDLIDIIPEYLDQTAKVYYQFLLNELKPVGLLCNLDISTLAQTAEVLAGIQECDEIIKRDGRFIEKYDNYGNVSIREHPAIRTKMNYMGKYQILSNALGMSPAARASIAGKQIEAKVADTDPLLRLVKS